MGSVAMMTLASKAISIVELDRILAYKFGEVPIEMIFAALHGLDAVVGEFLDCIQFSLMQLFHADSASGISSPNSLPF